MLTFHCSKCGQRIGLQTTDAGKLVRCPSCQGVVRAVVDQPNGQRSRPAASPLIDLLNAHETSEPRGLVDAPTRRRGPAIVVALAVIAVLTLGLVAIGFVVVKGERKELATPDAIVIADQTDDGRSTDAAGRSRSSPAPQPPRQPSLSVDEQLAALDQVARAALAHEDFVKVAEVLAARHAVIAAAAERQSSPPSPWDLDRRISAEAEYLIRQSRYADAVHLLQERWNLRKGQTSCASDLAVRLVQASLSAIVVEDQPVIPMQQMAQILDEAVTLDPINLEAHVLRTWMLPQDPREELLRLDARPSVLERNRLLLPIQASFQAAAEQYVRTNMPTDAKAAESFLGWTGDGPVSTSHLAAVFPKLPPELVRRILGPLLAALGDSRLPVLNEYEFWSSRLAEPNVQMVDQGGRRIMLFRGLLWQESYGPSGPELQLLQPHRGGWKALPISIVHWTNDVLGTIDFPPGEAMEQQKLIHAGLASTAPSDQFEKISSFSLAVYPGSATDIFELLEADVSVFRCPISTVRIGWQSIKRFALPDKTLEGRHLMLNEVQIGQIEQLAGLLDAQQALRDQDATLSVLAQATGQPEGRGGGRGRREAEPPQLWPLRPLMLVADTTRATDADVQFFTEEQGPFLWAQDRQVWLRPSLRMELFSDGGGRITLPLQYSTFDREPMRALFIWWSASAAGRQRSPQSIQTLREALADLGQAGPTTDELLVTAIAENRFSIDDRKLGLKLNISNRPADRAQLRRAQAVVQRSFAVLGSAARSDLARIAYGLDPRGQLTLASIPPSRQASQVSIVTLDPDGQERGQFYDIEALLRLHNDLIDFVRPSALLVPHPSHSEIIALPTSLRAASGSTQGQTSDHQRQALRELFPLDFAMQRAARAFKEGDLHLAAALYREMPTPDFDEFEPVNTKQPINQQQVGKLAEQMEWTIRQVQFRLDARLRLAEVLNAAGRQEAAVAVQQSAVTEWRAGVQPLFQCLRRFFESYGYVVPDRVRTAERAIDELIDALPQATQPPMRVDEFVTFDTAQAQLKLETPEELDALVNAFLARRPGMNAYRGCKRWLAEHMPQMLRRRPQDRFAVAMLMWAPSVVSEGSIVRIRPFADDEPANETTRSWEQAIHAVELGDYAAARQMLISGAWRHRQIAADHSVESVEAAVHHANAIGLLWLATRADDHAFGPARLNRQVLAATRVELDSSLVPQMRASSLPERQIRGLMEPLRLLMRATDDATNSYGRQRFFWGEYTRLVPDLEGVF